MNLPAVKAPHIITSVLLKIPVAIDAIFHDNHHYKSKKSLNYKI